MRIFTILTLVTVAVVIAMIQIRGYFAVGAEMIIPAAVLIYLVKREVNHEEKY